MFGLYRIYTDTHPQFEHNTYRIIKSSALLFEKYAIFN